LHSGDHTADAPGRAPLPKPLLAECPTTSRGLSGEVTALRVDWADSRSLGSAAAAQRATRVDWANSRSRERGCCAARYASRLGELALSGDAGRRVGSAFG